MCGLVSHEASTVIALSWRGLFVASEQFFGYLSKYSNNFLILFNACPGQAPLISMGGQEVLLRQVFKLLLDLTLTDAISSLS